MACAWALVLRHGAPLPLPLLLLLWQRLQWCRQRRWCLHLWLRQRLGLLRRLGRLPRGLPATAAAVWAGHMHLLQVGSDFLAVLQLLADAQQGIQVQRSRGWVPAQEGRPGTRGQGLVGS